MKGSDCALLYSGGTDSTCAAALCAQKHDRVHLLTFYERATRGAPVPLENVAKLKGKYGEHKFSHARLSTDALLRRVSYDRYWRFLRRHGFFMLSTCGFSSLSWHARTIVYCLENGIKHAADGLTRELMHFPGHMDKVQELFRRLYAGFGIEYTNPVREWAVPPDQQFIDRLIVGRHGFFGSDRAVRTTGQYLFDQGLMPHPNVKGSAYDQAMQHDCYPFVLFNIFVFWQYLPWHDYASYETRMEALFSEKVEAMRRLIEDHRSQGAGSSLAPLFEAGL